MHRGLVATLGLLVAGCTAVPAPDTTRPFSTLLSPRSDDEVLTPSWADRAPTRQDILRVYPPRALQEGVGALVHLDCKVLETRALHCFVGDETMAGYDFGAAALKAADMFIVKQDYPNAGPGARVRVPVQFVIE